MSQSVFARFAAALLGSGLVIAGAALPASAADAYTVTTLHFAVKTGPSDKLCDIVGDLYLPASASPTSRVPAILTTNGFGGSKDDQKGSGINFASNGYAVLSYSGLGFGGSDCKITLDDPDWDGKAASQLVSYLGGKDGIAFTDDAHTNPAPVLDVVVKDTEDHLGHASTFDPRVGMIGGSYGGQIQFAAAGVDPRIDTIVPIITWNDLSYALGPNNTAQTSGVTTSTPGATKLTWGLFFSVLGVANGLENAGTDQTRLLPCPNFADFVCPALVFAGTTGYFDDTSQASLRHASVATYMNKIKIPTLLMQGQSDTLFNLNEAAATYAALKSQGTPVKMIWQSWGHSNGTPAPGELNLAATDPSGYYQNGRVVDWFEHYLKDSSVDTGPAFSYFRDWISYSGNAAPAYASSNSFPVGTAKKFYLSGNTALSTSALGLVKKGQTFTTPPAGPPTSISSLDALGSVVKLPVPEADLPGTYARFTSPKLTSDLDVVGSPTLNLKVIAPVAQASQATGPAGQLVLFVRVQDVAPDGTATDIRTLTAPVRVPNVKVAFKTTLPAFVHRFAAGHKVRLVVAGGSLNYRGGLTPQAVGIQSGSTSQVLSLPAVN
jgi:pimeloyl-ACP methyl ester carboxylesterase